MSRDPEKLWRSLTSLEQQDIIEDLSKILQEAIYEIGIDRSRAPET